EVRDLWPEVFVELGALRPGLAMHVLQRMARFLYRRADLVVPLTASFATTIAGYGVPIDRIVVVPNGADVPWFARDVGEAATKLRRRLDLEGCFVVAYVGAFGVSQALSAVLRAAASCRDLHDVRFL